MHYAGNVTKGNARFEATESISSGFVAISAKNGTTGVERASRTRNNCPKTTSVVSVNLDFSVLAFSCGNN